MIRSMTGYGKGEAGCPRGNFVVEVRCVNHRYAELAVKLPRMFLAGELELRKAAGARIRRGKADIFVQWDPQAASVQAPPINVAVAKGYCHAFQELAHELRLSPEIPLSLIIAQRNVLQETAAVEDEQDLLPELLRALAAALDGLDGMRLREGEALAADLRERRMVLEQLAGEVRDRAPQVIDEYRERLRQRLERLLEGVELDPQRLAQEVAVMADRCDITEELVRLQSHFAQFDEIVQLDEPVGRKLDFLMQEFNREVNTIGSKANDAAITALVVKMKAELEKMREQVQNVE